MSGDTTALGLSAVAEPAAGPHRWKTILGGGVIVLAALAAYYNSFTVPFLFDDHSSIERNPTIRHLWPIWKALSPPAKSMVAGRPVVNFSLALNYAWGGLAVGGYHAFNLAVHVLAGLTLYGILRRTFARPVLPERFAVSGEWVALAVAVLWTVHPLQTEAVTFVWQRCESLMGLFYLLTLYSFVRGLKSPRHGRWFVLSVVACALGMATKEVMVTAPLMVLLYDRTFVSQSLREASTRHGRLYLGLASTWLLLGYLMVGLGNRGVGYSPGITWWGYALTECRAVMQYLRLAIWPHPLIFDYGPYVPIGHLAAAAPYALILVVLATGVLVALKWQPAIGFVGAWFFVILAPTSSLVPMAGSPVEEHRMYLPLAAVATLGVVGAVALGKRLFTKQQGVLLGCVAGGSVAVLLTFLTIQRNQDYDSELTIWRDTVEKCPTNPRAYNNLGLALFQPGQVQEAIVQFEQALRIKPDYAEAHNNLGSALLQAGRLPEAIEQHEQALHLKPDSAEAQYNLGHDLEQAGRRQEAIGHYEQALQIQPDSAEAHNNLGLALMAEGRLPEAIGHYEQALRIQPDYAQAQCNLGNALLRVGRVQDAIGHYEQALRLNPDYAKAHNGLGSALMAQGRVQDAINHYQQALRIKPDFAEALFNLGLAWEQIGAVQEAIRDYEQALRIKPDLTEARTALARLRARQ